MSTPFGEFFEQKNLPPILRQQKTRSGAGVEGSAGEGLMLLAGDKKPPEGG